MCECQLNTYCKQTLVEMRISFCVMPVVELVLLPLLNLHVYVTLSTENSHCCVKSKTKLSPLKTNTCSLIPSSVHIDINIIHFHRNYLLKAQYHLITDCSKVFLSPQGFLSDLLKKANRNYDDKKLNEYTQTIVSINRQNRFFLDSASANSKL